MIEHCVHNSNWLFQLTHYIYIWDYNGWQWCTNHSFWLWKTQQTTSTNIYITQSAQCKGGIHTTTLKTWFTGDTNNEVLLQYIALCTYFEDNVTNSYRARQEKIEKKNPQIFVRKCYKLKCDEVPASSTPKDVTSLDKTCSELLCVKIFSHPSSDIVNLCSKIKRNCGLIITICNRRLITESTWLQLVTEG